MRIGILGPGRLGRTLARLFAERGHDVDLGGRGAHPVGDVVFLTVPDGSLPEAAAGLPPGPIVLHCSGAAPVDVLRPHAPAGSLHPLMTFPGPDVSIPDLRGVPAAVEGDARAVEVATELALDLGFSVIEVRGDRRLYHAAAVMAGNLTSVLFADAARVLTECGVDPSRASSALLPLALQSLRNAAEHPDRALTGPVARGDEATIGGHRAALEAAGFVTLLPEYDALTKRARLLLRGRTPSFEQG